MVVAVCVSVACGSIVCICMSPNWDGGDLEKSLPAVWHVLG